MGFSSRTAPLFLQQGCAWHSVLSASYFKSSNRTESSCLAWHPETLTHSLPWALVSFFVGPHAWLCACGHLLRPFTRGWACPFYLGMEPGSWGWVNTEWGYVVKLYYGTWDTGKHSTLDLYQCQLLYLALIAKQGCSVWVSHNYLTVASSQAFQWLPLDMLLFCTCEEYVSGLYILKMKFFSKGQRHFKLWYWTLCLPCQTLGAEGAAVNENDTVYITIHVWTCLSSVLSYTMCYEVFWSLTVW